MKQLQNNNFNDLSNNLVYLLYANQPINQSIVDTFGYDLNEIVNKDFNEVTTIHTLGKYNFKTITFIGLGKSDEITTKKIREIGKTIANIKETTIYVDELVADSLNMETLIKPLVEGYVINSYQERKSGHEVNEITDLDIIYTKENIEDAINEGKIYGEGINYAKILSDTPANIMTPDKLVEKAIKLANEYNMEYTILDKDTLKAMQAGGILAVNQGSNVPAFIICLKYNNSDEPYSAIVGKGLTFDSGGYNLKSNSYGMKYDMCGGADVLGIMKILAATKAKTNVYGIIPTTENLLNEMAYRPQDVITTLSKKTVEIVSTDAEGRLILADAITYGQQLGATKIIDLATLTGACARALGSVYTGVFSNDDEFYHEFAKALDVSDEKGWRLPLDDEYFKGLESKSADFKNSAGNPLGGASVAASFLNEFIEDGTKWIHLDIAGTADVDSKESTGAMIRSIVNLLKK